LATPPRGPACRRARRRGRGADIAVRRAVHREIRCPLDRDGGVRRVRDFLLHAFETDDAIGVHRFRDSADGHGYCDGTFFVAILAITFDGIAPPRVPAASGLAVFLRTLAGSFATSITTTFWDRREAWYQTQLAGASSIYDPSAQSALAQLKAAGMSDTAALATLNRELVGQSYLLSSLDFFWISAIACLVLIVFVWFTHKPGGGGGPPVAAD